MYRNVPRHVHRHVQRHVHAQQDMCTAICIGMCVGMCVSICVRHVCRRICRHVHTHVHRHVHPASSCLKQWLSRHTTSGHDWAMIGLAAAAMLLVAGAVLFACVGRTSPPRRDTASQTLTGGSHMHCDAQP